LSLSATRWPLLCGPQHGLQFLKALLELFGLADLRLHGDHANIRVVELAHNSGIRPIHVLIEHVTSETL